MHKNQIILSGILNTYTADFFNAENKNENCKII